MKAGMNPNSVVVDLAFSWKSDVPLCLFNYSASNSGAKYPCKTIKIVEVFFVFLKGCLQTDLQF